ncbi:hypothetical protein [Sporosarcina beigongshangi]|uniref:hypothetical protein n=1 Tax=Sporosarcina beigongshangi TaxID=2782538 RepID=UPI00193A1D75|nr:hypothetical protein [Sporosarcina beigongshangi]
MKEIYRKTSKISFLGGIGATIFGIIFYFYGYEGFSENGDLLFVTGLFAVSGIGAGFYFKNAHEKLSNETMSASLLNLEDLHELNFQRVPALLPKMYNVDSNGNPLCIIEPSKGRLSRWLTIFNLFEKGFIIPVHYDILDTSGQRIATFTIQDNVKRYELSLRKPDGTLMSTYVQHLSKSALKNRGILYHADGTIWRELEAKNMAGDIDVKDEEGRMTASYRFGIFPYAMNPAFVSTAHHEHVRLGAHISADEKLAYIMIFFLWLKG